jgi:predicted nucleic acid-binding protein
VSAWIIDASLAMNWYLTDEQDRGYSVAVFSALEEREILVPSLWLFEIANVLLVAHRRGRIPTSQIEYVLETITGFGLRLDHPTPDSPLRIYRPASQYQLTVYDAAYLDLAMRERAPIATRDKALLAAMSAAGVEAVVPTR